MIQYFDPDITAGREPAASVQLISFCRIRHAKPFTALPCVLTHPKILYSSTGTLHVRIFGKLVCVTDDRFILLKAGCSVEYDIPVPGSIVSELEFSASTIPALDDAERNYIVGKNTHVGDLFYHLNEFCQRKPLVPHVPEALTALILEQVLSCADMDIPGQDLYHRFREYVDNNIGKNLSAVALSEALRYNKDYICRVVKRFSGKTLKEYIACQRLIMAKTMLSSEDTPIGVIAEAVGCSSPELFCKFFRYYTHMSPLEYRRQFHKEV